MKFKTIFTNNNEIIFYTSDKELPINLINEAKDFIAAFKDMTTEEK